MEYQWNTSERNKTRVTQNPEGRGMGFEWGGEKKVLLGAWGTSVGFV